MKKLCLLLVISLIIPFFNFNVSSVYEIDAKAYVLLVADTLEIYGGKNFHERLPIASTTKIATAITFLENFEDINKNIVVPKEASGIEGSSIYLYQGETISVEALLYGLLLESGNDAAVALALTCCESLDIFVDLMNQLVKKLGLKNTHFTNPHGLDDPNHYSSAYDLSLIMNYAMKNETFAKITATKNISFKNEDDVTHFFTNHNRLIRMRDYIVGGKTGFTKISRRCLVSSAKLNGINLICTTIDCSNDFNEHISMYDNAFSAYQLYEIPINSEIKLDVVGSIIEKADLKYEEIEKIPLKSKFDLNSVSYKIITHKFIYAPQKSGTNVGKIKIYYDNNLIKEKDLILKYDIKQIPSKNPFKKAIEYIRRILKI